MSTTYPGDAQQIENYLREMDARGETSGPEEDEEETAGPEEEEQEEQETAGPDGDEEDTGDINALLRTGKRAFSAEEVRVLQRRARSRERAAQRKRSRIKSPVPPRNLVAQGQGARKLLDKWVAKGEPFTVRQAGHYYYVAEVKYLCEGNNERAWVRVPANTQITFFDQSVGDETTFLGNPTKVNLRMTNYQRPSKNTYNEQDFLIQSVTMREAGLRVRYEESALATLSRLGGSVNTLLGRGWVWDDRGLFLPMEIFNDYSGENMLYRALRGSAVLSFQWEKRKVGGNGTMRSVLIDTVESIPDMREKRLSRTSGGGAVLSVPDGYVFTDNPEKSEEGQFTAVMTLEDEVVFPIKPVNLGGPTPVKPVEMGLYVQLSLNGISFEHVKRDVLIQRA